MGYNELYRKNFEQYAELASAVNDKQSRWTQHILFLSATLFGILISLHTAIEASRYIRLFFAAATISLALGILLLSVNLYGHTAIWNNTKILYLKELQSAIHEGRELRPVFGKVSKFYAFAGTIAYICLVLSVLLLATYSVLITLC